MLVWSPGAIGLGQFLWGSSIAPSLKELGAAHFLALSPHSRPSQPSSVASFSDLAGTVVSSCGKEVPFFKDSMVR